MLQKTLSVVFLFCMVTFGFSVNQILYLAPPVPGPTTTNYPQEADTGYFLHMIMRDHLSALAAWEVVTEAPTNTKNTLIYRLETTYTLSGPIPRPECNYVFRFYDNNNKLLFQTNIVTDIKYGLFDASDVAVFATGKVLGEDLSQNGFLSLVVPPMGSLEYELYLNKSRVLVLTNTEHQTLQYRVSANKTTTISLRERPSLKNLWLGVSLWQTNIVLEKGKSETLTINPQTKVSLRSVRTELWNPYVYAYELRVRPLNEQIPPTNITLSTKHETNIELPLGQRYTFDVVYTLKNLTVSSDTVFLQRPTYSYQPVDRKQTRPFYGSLETAVYLPPDARAGLPPFIRGALTLYYYPMMNLRCGATITKDSMFDIIPDVRINSNSIVGISLRVGWHPLTYRYQGFRLTLEGSAGFQRAQISFTTERTDIDPQTLENLDNTLSTVMTGFLFEASAGVEFYFLSVGIGGWLAPRYHPSFVGSVNAWGINIFGRIIL